MARKKKPEIDFPIFSVHGNYLDEDIEQAVNLRATILELSENIDEVNKELKNLGQKLNIYINNTVKRKKPFDFLHEMIIFSDKNEISFYPHEIIEQYMEESEEELEEEEVFGLLPPTDDKAILNQKQTQRCMELIESYNQLFMEYEYMLYDLEECNNWYGFIIDGVKEELSEIKLFDVKSKDESDIMEAFDDDIHELLITRDTDTKKWKFIYIRKEDRQKFIDYIEYRKTLGDNE
jgi:hypothetical protein